MSTAWELYDAHRDSQISAELETAWYQLDDALCGLSDGADLETMNKAELRTVLLDVRKAYDRLDGVLVLLTEARRAAA